MKRDRTQQHTRFARERQGARLVAALGGGLGEAEERRRLRAAFDRVLSRTGQEARVSKRAEKRGRELKAKWARNGSAPRSEAILHMKQECAQGVASEQCTTEPCAMEDPMKREWYLAEGVRVRVHRRLAAHAPRQTETEMSTGADEARASEQQDQARARQTADTAGLAASEQAVGTRVQRATPTSWPCRLSTAAAPR